MTEFIKKDQNKSSYTSERTLLIGGQLANMRSQNFLDAYNLVEFENIIVIASGVFNGVPYIRDSRVEMYQQFEHLSDWCNERSDEIMEWVSSGGTLIVTIDHISCFQLISLSSHRYCFSDLKFFEGIKTSYKTGKLVEFCGPPSAMHHFAPLMSDALYNYVLELSGPTPLFRVSGTRCGTGEPVGAMRRIGKGRVLFVPPVNANNQVPFYTALIEFAAHDASQSQYSLPEWTKDYLLPREMTALDEKSTIERQIEELRFRQTQLTEAVSREQQLKALFTATGEPLVDAVLLVFQELGLKTCKGPHPRADLIGVNSERPIGIEVKGLDGCAREANLRQVDRWKAEIDLAIASLPADLKRDSDLLRYAETLSELGIKLHQEEISDPYKGIMVINTYRGIPLANRNDPDFPVPLLKKIEASHVCALTGVQLLGLLLEAREEPEKKSEIISRLLSTDGVIYEATGWQRYLKHA